MNNLQEAINRVSDDKLASNSMVYQVWDDGEITLQKAGDLLWQRSLHCMKPALHKPSKTVLWPHTYNNHGYAFVTEQNATHIRELIGNMCIQDIKIST